MAESTSNGDPTCGMHVDPTTTPAHDDYRGHRYCFCSKHCGDVFALDPEKFLRHPPRPNPFRMPGQ